MSKGIQSEKKSAYAQAGVNIDVKMNAVGSIKEMVAATKTQAVIGNIGAFGGLHKVPTGKDEILVASADGVGTKLKVAAMMNKHDTVGQDIVNHCVNDILVQGALPLFFMDYIGTAKVDPAVIDLSNEFQYGGGTESQYSRLHQLIQTVINLNLQKPVYLYLNGEKAEVIGGEGILITQPLSKDSLNE